MRVSLLLITVLFEMAFLTGCADEQAKHGKRLQGVVVSTGDKTTLFFGHRSDPMQQLKDLQAGVVMDEVWHMVELPKTNLPSVNDEVSYDLAKYPDIKITQRKPLGELSIVQGDPNWSTVSLDSASNGLEGDLTITGANVVKEVKPAATTAGNFYGVAFLYSYDGPLTVNGATVNMKVTSGLGAFAGVSVP